MSVVLMYGSGVPTIKVGRIAGQFSKPRSAPTETRDGVTLPSFRGDSVNDFAFDDIARRPDPTRLVHAYHQSAATLNLVRAFAKGGFADLSRVNAWNQEFVERSPEGQRYEVLAGEIQRALRFMQACGIELESELKLHEVDIWTAHEALLLGYEEALTRRDSITDDWYDCSAHLLWIGERTRRIDGAHVEFLAGVHNPIGVKLGPTTTPEETIALCERLDPGRTPGRLVLFSRMGADHIAEALPPLFRAVKLSGHPVVWACDPMHGNTFQHESGYKTRRFDDIMARAPRLLRRVRGRRRVARWRARRADGRGRHRVPRWRRRGARRPPREPVRDDVRPEAQRPPVARPRVRDRRAPAPLSRRRPKQRP